MKGMIRAIIFDCFGVLTTDLWKEFVATLPHAQVDAARDLNYRYDSGRLTRAEFKSEIEKLTGSKPREVEKLVSGEAYKNTELLELIGELSKHYKIGLLSNIASNWVLDVFLTAAEQELFDDFIFSHEVGMAKPDSRIFELAAKRLGVAPSECAFIDDSERHCAAAASLGMKTVVYENLPRMRGELDKILA